MKNNRKNVPSPKNNRKMFFNWARENFSRKNNFIRLACLVIALVILLPTGITMNLWSQHQISPTFGQNGFITIHIVYNDGLGFSFMKGMPPPVIYAVQSVMTIIIFGVFLCSKKPYLIFLFALAFVGGLFNVVDRSCPKINCSAGGVLVTDSVVDYFKFSFQFAIFNIPDMGIVIGIFGGGGIYFVTSFIEIFKEQKKIKKIKHK